MQTRKTRHSTSSNWIVDMSKTFDTLQGLDQWWNNVLISQTKIPKNRLRHCYTVWNPKYRHCGWLTAWRNRAAHPLGRPGPQWNKCARSPGHWCSPPHAAHDLKEEQHRTGQNPSLDSETVQPGFIQRTAPSKHVQALTSFPHFHMCHTLNIFKISWFLKKNVLS